MVSMERVRVFTVRSGKRAKVIVEEEGLVQVKDEGAIESIVDEILTENPKEVEQFHQLPVLE